MTQRVLALKVMLVAVAVAALISVGQAVQDEHNSATHDRTARAVEVLHGE